MSDGIRLLQQRLTQLEDRIAVQDRVWAALLCSDLGDWVGAGACYTSDATVDLIDYDASIWPEPLDMSIAEFRRRALTFMPGFSIRQHMATNFSISVDGDDATSSAQVRAIHLIEGRVWEAFDDGVWGICNLRAKIIHQSGAELEETARQKVAAH